MTFGPIASIFINRFGNRISMVTGGIICASSLLISSFMKNIYSLFGTFSVLYGLGTCMATSPTMTIAPNYFDKYVSVAIGLTTAGSSIGTLVMAPLSQSLIAVIGWRNTFRCFIGTCLLTALFNSFIKPLEPKITTTNFLNRRPSSLKKIIQNLQLWRNRVFIVWTFAITSVMFGFYIPYVHLVSYAIDVGISPDKGSIIVMLLGASTAIGRISFGKIVSLGILNRLHMHQLSMVVTGTGMMFLPLIKTFEGIVAYVILVGLVDGCYVVLLPVLTAHLMGVENTVIAWGFLVGTSSITFTLGPPIAGALYDSIGSYDVAFHCAGVPVICGAIILFLIPWAQRTSKTQNIEIEISEEKLRNEYDLTDEILLGPRETHISPSVLTVTSGALVDRQYVKSSKPFPSKLQKTYKEQSTTTTPRSSVGMQVDIHDAIQQLNHTREMLERISFCSTFMSVTSGNYRSTESKSENFNNPCPYHNVPSSTVSIMSVPNCCRHQHLLGDQNHHERSHQKNACNFCQHLQISTSLGKCGLTLNSQDMCDCHECCASLASSSMHTTYCNRDHHHSLRCSHKQLRTKSDHCSLCEIPSSSNETSSYVESGSLTLHQTYTENTNFKLFQDESSQVERKNNFVRSPPAISPALDTILEMPVHGDSNAETTDWVDNSPNDPNLFSQKITSAPASPSCSLSLVEHTSGSSDVISQQSNSSSYELDVFKHIFKDDS